MSQNSNIIRCFLHCVLETVAVFVRKPVSSFTVVRSSVPVIFLPERPYPAVRTLLNRPEGPIIYALEDLS